MPLVWNLGPSPSSVWYNPTALHTNCVFHNNETQLVQNLKQKYFLNSLCCAMKGNKARLLHLCGVHYRACEVLINIADIVLI